MSKAKAIAIIEQSLNINQNLLKTFEQVYTQRQDKITEEGINSIKTKIQNCNDALK